MKSFEECLFTKKQLIFILEVINDILPSLTRTFFDTCEELTGIKEYLEKLIFEE